MKARFVEMLLLLNLHIYLVSSPNVLLVRFVDVWFISGPRGRRGSGRNCSASEVDEFGA